MKDLWDGDAVSPISYNSWLYAYANPINYADPSGLNPNCQDNPETCAIERAVKEILSNEHGLIGLLDLFNDEELYTTWGNIAGRTVGERLDWVLKISQSLIIIPYQSLRPPKSGTCQIGDPLQWRRLSKYDSNTYYGSDYGFGSANGFDDDFVENDNSDQSSHFLTAVGLTKNYGPAGLIGIIGHEKYASNNPLVPDRLIQVLKVRPIDIYHFLRAVDYDAAGEKTLRDNELWPILEFHKKLDPKDPYEDPSRQGNTMQDLRLSVKGYRFAYWATQNSGAPAWLAASWLYNQLARPGLEIPSPWWRNTNRTR